MLPARDHEAVRLAQALRGELERDKKILAERLMAELYGGLTQQLGEQEYLDFRRRQGLTTDVGLAETLYKQVGAQAFVSTMAALHQVPVAQYKQQLLTQAEQRALAASFPPGGMPTQPAPPLPAMQRPAPNTLAASAAALEASRSTAAAPIDPLRYRSEPSLAAAAQLPMGGPDIMGAPV